MVLMVLFHVAYTPSSFTTKANNLTFASTFFDRLSCLCSVTNVTRFMASSFHVAEEADFQPGGIDSKLGKLRNSTLY